MKNKVKTFIWLITGVWLVSSCNVTKNVPEGKQLLTENKIEVNGKTKTENQLNPYIIQRPNAKSKLFFFNLANPDYLKKWDDKILKYSDSAHFWTKVLSLKQTIGYANFRKGINEKLMKSGEPPVLLNEDKTQKTIETLHQYYIDQGYFKARTTYQIDSVAPKKASVTYRINTDEPFTIDSIKIAIASPVIDSIYQLKKNKSHIKTGQRFERENFENEADRLTKEFRNAGVYQFSKYSINFREVDSTRADYKTNVILDIANRVSEKEDTIIEEPYQIAYIDKVNVFTDKTYLNAATSLNDSLFYKGIHLYAYEKIDYKPKFLTRSIFVKPGEHFSDLNTELTRKHLNNLDGFKTIRINYEEVEKNKLTANIFLTPVKKYGIKLETEATHSNIKPFGISGKISFKSNNTFKGNEILQLSLQGSFLNSSAFQGPFFNAWETGADVSLKVPRISFPFKIQKIIPQRMVPKTTFTFGSSLQKNIGLDKQRFTGIVEYTWKPNNKIDHSVELLNLQYIKNLNISSFFTIYTSEYRKLQNIQQTYYPAETLNSGNAIAFMNTVLADENFKLSQPDAYQTVQNVSYRYSIITEDVLVPLLSYGFTYNTQSNYKDLDYSFYRARLSSSGLLTNLLMTDSNGDGVKKMFDTNIAQFVKLDLEYRRHWQIYHNNVLAFRTNVGVAIPYGNSKEMPFNRSYFIGGSNDLRAWKIYQLGPGAEKSGLEFNVGNFKLLSSLEYRFDIFDSYKGAIFIDAGNVWDISNSELTTDEARFTGLGSLKNMGIGSGFGLRYDFSFLVFRADVGFKTYEPYNVSGKKWFQNYNFSKAVLNIGINYPF